MNENLVRSKLFVIDINDKVIPTAKVGAIIMQREAAKVKAAVDALGFHYAETKFVLDSENLDKKLPFAEPIFITGKYAGNDTIFLYVSEESDIYPEEERLKWSGYIKEMAVPYSMYDALPTLP